MEILSRAAFCAVVGSLLALLLRKHTPELSLTVTMITGSVVVWLSASLCARLVETMRDVADRSGIPGAYLTPVLKCVGIAVVANLAAQLCRDAQQSSTAAAVELCASLCALYAALRLLPETEHEAAKQRFAAAAGAIRCREIKAGGFPCVQCVALAESLLKS